MGSIVFFVAFLVINFKDRVDINNQIETRTDEIALLIYYRVWCSLHSLHVACTGPTNLG